MIKVLDKIEYLQASQELSSYSISRGVSDVRDCATPGVVSDNSEGQCVYGSPKSQAVTEEAVEFGR